MLGFIPAVTAGVNIIGKLESMLGIGGGRREADQIVPVQNEIVDTVLGPIIEIKDSGRPYSYDQYRQMYDTLVTTEQAWLRFLHGTNWSDGRAAVQAEATLQPYFTSAKSGIAALMNEQEPSTIPDPIVNIGPGSGGYIDPITGLPVQPTYTPTYGPTSSGAASTFSNPWFIAIAVGAGLLFLSSGKRR